MVETLHLRPAGMEDAKRLFDWRNHADTRAQSITTDEWDWDTHWEWLERSLARTDRLMFIGVARRTDQAIGLVRLDRLGPAIWEVYVTVAPEYRGRGWAAKLLEAGLAHGGEAAFLARIRAENLKSRALFERAGFQPIRTTDGMMLYRLARKEAA